MSSNTAKFKPTATGNNKVWAYFEQCDHDPHNNNNSNNNNNNSINNNNNKARCLLCSTELCNKGATSILWNHLKVEHSIDRKNFRINDHGHTIANLDKTKTIAKTYTTELQPSIKQERQQQTSIIDDNNVDNHQNHLANSNNRIVSINSLHVANKIDNHLNGSVNNMTQTIPNQQAPESKSRSTPSGHFQPQHHHKKLMVVEKAKSRSISSSKDTKFSALRRSLDLIDYDDLEITSMKPSPSSSISKNLISRLNQISSPVTRKLKFWNKKSFQVNQYDPSFKVIYLGNLGMQLWSKDESCLDKPLSTLWNNYLVNMKTEIVMRLTICNSGLKAITRQHGLTQYWSNRLVYCCSHKNYPKIFSWIYRHEGKKMRQELRCHAVFCSSPEKASKMVTLLNQRLACALQEFKREKKSRGPAIVTNNVVSSSLMAAHQRLPRTIPLRRQILAKGSANFRPPLERSKSAPKLTSIMEEDYDFEEDEEEDDDGGSHDEFEFEQTFGHDKDDDEDSDYDDGLVKEEEEEEEDGEEDSTHKLDYNSLTTTVNEETSNSSVCATGDNSYDNKQHMLTRDRLDGAPVEHSANESDSISTSSRANNVSSISPQELSSGKGQELFAGNSVGASNEENHRIMLDGHKSQDNELSRNQISKQESSANIHHSSSLNNSNTTKQLRQQSFVSTEQEETTHLEKRDEIEEDGDMEENEAKNNNMTKMGNITKQRQSVTGHVDDRDETDDAPTQEIVLSWSNLVIK